MAKGSVVKQHHSKLQTYNPPPSAGPSLNINLQAKIAATKGGTTSMHTYIMIENTQKHM